jgi:hypothetical protein
MPALTPLPAPAFIDGEDVDQCRTRAPPPRHPLQIGLLLEESIACLRCFSSLIGRSRSTFFRVQIPWWGSLLNSCDDEADNLISRDCRRTPTCRTAMRAHLIHRPVRYAVPPLFIIGGNQSPPGSLSTETFRSIIWIQRESIARASLAGTRFSSESAFKPFHHRIRRRGGTI